MANLSFPPSSACFGINSGQKKKNPSPFFCMCRGVTFSSWRLINKVRRQHIRKTRPTKTSDSSNWNWHGLRRAQRCWEKLCPLSVRGKGSEWQKTGSLGTIHPCRGPWGEGGRHRQASNLGYDLWASPCHQSQTWRCNARPSPLKSCSHLAMRSGTNDKAMGTGPMLTTVTCSAQVMLK